MLSDHRAIMVHPLGIAGVYNVTGQSLIWGMACGLETLAGQVCVHNYASHTMQWSTHRVPIMHRHLVRETMIVSVWCSNVH